MNKSLRSFFIILVILSIIPGYSLFKWAFQPKKELKILILDKTVPTFYRENHRSFNWILTHEKYVKSDHKRYNNRKDYYGFFPLKPKRSKQYEIKRIQLSNIISMADSFDMAYYTDTYGVYFNDWYKGISKTRRSRKIYGGLNNNDYLFLREMKARKKLLIGEYDIMAYPTDPLERVKTEEIFGVKWTEWLGKYFSSLDSIKNPKLPEWIMNTYREQYQKSWTFKNGGIVFINYNNRVVVLEDKKDLDFNIPYIYTTEYGQEKYGLSYQVPFPYWFEIVEPGNNKVISYFKIHVNEIGDSILTENSIPSYFPAVMESSTDHPYYYLAGNFAKNPVQMRTSYFYNYDKLSKMLDIPFLSYKRYFYWNFYQPLMTNILDRYYEKIKQKNNNTVR